MSTTESGITRRGNCILRTMFSLFTTERTARVVDSEKSAEERQVEEQELGVVGDPSKRMILVNTVYRTANRSRGRTSDHR